MEHPCPRCNAPVDDSIPFCPTCEASQIKAHAKQYSRESISVLPAMSSGQIVADDVTPQVHRARADSHAELRSALYAGLVGALLSPIWPPVSFVLALPLAGVLSVLLYRRRGLGDDPSRRVGFRLGALSGLLSFGFLMVLSAFGTLVSHNEADAHAAVIQIIQRAEARNPDPQVRQLFDYFMTPHGMAVMMIFGFVIMCVTFVLLSGIGGAVSASFLRRKGSPRP